MSFLFIISPLCFVLTNLLRSHINQFFYSFLYFFLSLNIGNVFWKNNSKILVWNFCKSVYVVFCFVNFYLWPFPCMFTELLIDLLVCFFFLSLCEFLEDCDEVSFYQSAFKFFLRFLSVVVFIIKIIIFQHLKLWLFS